MSTLEKIKEAVAYNASADERKRSWLQFCSIYYDQFLAQFPAYNAARKGADALPQNQRAAIINPMFGETAIYFRITTDDEAKALLKNARSISSVLSRMSLEDRVRLLAILGEKIEQYQEDIALTISADTGKPIDVARKEMTKGKAWINDAGLEKLTAQLKRPDTGAVAEPLGAVLIVGAYNYPFALAINGIIASLAGGNGTIISAVDRAPNWVFPFLKAATEAFEIYAAEATQQHKSWAEDFHHGVEQGHIFQLSIGRNDYLSSNADMMQFVGSTPTGMAIMKSRGSKPTIAEMGGNSIVVIMNSFFEGKDRESAGDQVAREIWGGFGPGSGQRCTAPRVLCVQHGDAEIIREKLKKFAIHPYRALKSGQTLIGNPFEQGVQMGPMVDANAHRRIQTAIQLASDVGAEVFQSAEQLHINGGLWVYPVVIDWSEVDIPTLGKEDRVRLDDILIHETFGPLLHIVHSVENLDEAIARTDRYDHYKLAGAIYTKDHAEAMRFKDATRITTLAHNTPPADKSPALPHGGPEGGYVGGPGYYAKFVK